MEGKRLWIYGGAIIALIILAILFARDHHPAKAPVQGPATAAWPAHEVGPETAKAPAASRPAPAAAVQPKPAVPNAAANWRVIAYTFNREADAIKRVNAIKQTHPSLLPEVFQPSGHGPYLVSLGGELTKEEAERVRQRARADGMPRDTFVRNYR